MVCRTIARGVKNKQYLKVNIYVQKLRLARLLNAKLLSNKSFLRNKRRVEALLTSRGQNGGDLDPDLEPTPGYEVDMFQLQHHHLLSCLEQTTVRIS